MNRRKFLSWLGVGTAVAAVAPMALFAEGPASFDTLKNGGLICDLAEYGTTYGDYTNFSQLAISGAFDEVVANAAAELANAAALRIDRLVQS